MAGIDENTQLLVNFQEGETASANFWDSSKNAFTLTANGNFIVAGSGKFGNAGQSGGTGDSNYLSVPTNAVFAFGTGAFTIDFWLFIINNEGNQNPQYLVDCDGAATGVSCFRDGATNTIKCTINGTTYSSASGALNDSSYHHMAYVRESESVLKLYVDGVRKGTHDPSGKSVANSNGVRMQNSFGGSNQNDGQLCEVRISNIARWPGTFTTPVSPYSSTGIHSHA